LGSDSTLEAVLPPGSGYRRRRDRALGRIAELGLTARQLAAGVGREIDRAAEEMPARRVSALAIYSEPGAADMAAEVNRLRSSRHELNLALGAIGDPDPALGGATKLSRMSGGKFANLNRLAETASPLASDWVLVLDDDVELPRRFLDRLICVAESLRLDLAQPALTRDSHGAWEVNRRRAAMARETQFVEIGPAVLFSRRAWRELTPFPEAGMGWGLCLTWAAAAKRHGWRLGVIDAVPVRHARAIATGYDVGDAKAAAAELLEANEHIGREEAERVLASHAGLS
jgi:hypothetical protein